MYSDYRGSSARFLVRKVLYKDVVLAIIFGIFVAIFGAKRFTKIIHPRLYIINNIIFKSMDIF